MFHKRQLQGFLFDFIWKWWTETGSSSVPLRMCCLWEAGAVWRLEMNVLYFSLNNINIFFLQHHSQVNTSAFLPQIYPHCGQITTWLAAFFYLFLQRKELRNVVNHYSSLCSLSLVTSLYKSTWLQPGSKYTWLTWLPLKSKLYILCLCVRQTCVWNTNTFYFCSQINNCQDWVCGRSVHCTALAVYRSFISRSCSWSNYH